MLKTETFSVAKISTVIRWETQCNDEWEQSVAVCLGIIICTIVAFYQFKNTRKNERPGHASCSGQGRKCRLGKEDKKQKAVDKEDKKGKVVDKVTKKSFLYFGPILFYSK